VAKKVGFRYFDEKEKTSIRHCLYAVCPGKKNGGFFVSFMSLLITVFPLCTPYSFPMKRGLSGSYSA
jgi:hypothetical protein